MSGWAELGFRNEELFTELAAIVTDKAKGEAVFVKGDAMAVVNILRALESLELENDEFLEVLLEYISDNFDELKMPWAVTLMKTLGTITQGNQEMLLATMTSLCQPLHKKLKAAYDTSSKNTIAVSEIPDFTDYHSLWLTL